MSEKSQRQRVLKALKELDAKPIENLCEKGTPDVECILGWIELKWIADWPARTKTHLRIDHYTREQRIWARTRSRRGGNVWLLLQVELGDEWVLLDGRWAALNLAGDGGPKQGAIRREIYENALGHWSGLCKENLIQCLASTYDLTKLSDWTEADEA